MSKLNDFGFFNDCVTKYKDDKGDIKVYKWYTCWINMINRCYNPLDKQYKYYGARGIIIEDYFHLASNFKNFYEKHNPNEDLVMDKDIKGGNMYSRDTITFITKSENTKEMQNRQKVEGYPNFKRHDISHYETHSTFRFNFKKICKRKNLNFDDFNEIFDKRICCSNGKYRNRYFYFYTK